MIPSEQPAFGVALAEWRRNQGLRQDELAQKLGVILRTVQHWEAGESVPRRVVLQKLEQVMAANGEDQEDRLARLEKKIDLILERLKIESTSQAS